jgi:hypothetical protein
MEEIVLEPPKAKNERYWKRRDVVVISTKSRGSLLSRWNATSKTKRRGMLVALDWVMRKRTRRS